MTRATAVILFFSLVASAGIALAVVLAVGRLVAQLASLVTP